MGKTRRRAHGGGTPTLSGSRSPDRSARETKRWSQFDQDGLGNHAFGRERPKGRPVCSLTPLLDLLPDMNTENDPRIDRALRPVTHEAGEDYDHTDEHSKYKQAYVELDVMPGTCAPRDLFAKPDGPLEHYGPQSEEYLAALRIDANQAQEKLIAFLRGDPIGEASYKEPAKGKERTPVEAIQERLLGSSLSTKRREELYPTKKNERIHEKVDKYRAKGGGFECFTDIARGSLVFDTPAQLISAHDEILKRLHDVGWKVVKDTNRFQKDGTPDDHYRDILLNVAVPLGVADRNDHTVTEHVVELQLHLKDMLAAKSTPTTSIAPERYKRLHASARTLLAAHKDTTCAIDFSAKALHSLEEIAAADSPTKIGGGAGLSGHHLYNVKRYLFEHEKDLKKSGVDDSLTSQWRVWSEVSSKDIYDPAWAEVKSHHGDDVDDLQALRFTEKKKP